MVKVRDLFNSPQKDLVYEPGKLWPEVRDLGSRLQSYSTLTNYILFNNTASWRALTGLQSLFDWYHFNPIFYAVVMIKAREYANMEVEVWDKRHEVMIPRTSRIPIVKKIYDLLEHPNALQSRWEWTLQRKIFLEVAGNNFTYGNFIMGMPNPTVESLLALWNVWPQYMKYKFTKKYFEALNVSDIVEAWMFEAGPYKKEWQPHEVLHTNKPNTEITDDIIFGRSAAQNLVRPLSNIDMAYESRNVIMKNRGMRVIMTSDKGDKSGAVPLQDFEKEALQQSIKDYGMLEGQKQFFFTDMPMKVVPIDQDVMKLGLFEEIATDGMMVCHGYGVPEILLKLYIKGATFENHESSLRHLYQGTLIPEAKEDMNALSNFLGLKDTDYELRANFNHVPCLQESETKKETAAKTKADRLISELEHNLISPEEYREEMGYPPLPKKEPTTETEPAKDEIDEGTRQSQAELRGSVGGVQGILSIQASVGAGTTTRDAAISMLTLVYGFSKEQAEALLGEPVTQPSGNTQTTTTDEET